MIAPETRILVVDDSISFRSLLKKVLTGLGYTNIYQAEDGFKAMAVLKTAATNPEKKIGLIFSDWNMPECNGLDFFKMLKQDNAIKDTPFIMVTSENEVSQVLEAVNLGVTDYIVKPADPETVKQKIETLNFIEQREKRNVGKP